eukprot:TRINITY_DN588_c0_g2_i1.p1 TRINITY_DN588_c0_g2~~TRINITY_DN588_c0_g2_i1.p1  ORF type:complete len:428 (-),score=126.70 TRINITY_DN588_c0_g2_i1:23-1306(-)
MNANNMDANVGRDRASETNSRRNEGGARHASANAEREPPRIVERGDNHIVLECTAINSAGERVTSVVEVQLPRFPKPYLGGYRSLKNSLLYHNAFAQTDQIPHEHKTKFHREAQTVDYDTKSSKVPREMGTQMERTGIWIDPRTDKAMAPNFYFSSEMWEARREAAALFIQRHLRGYFARKRTRQLRKEHEDKRRDEVRAEEEFRVAEEVRHKREIERRMHPRTKDDFMILYDELELWRLNETNRIRENTTMTADERRIAMKALLDKETELLQTIDRLKLQAGKLNKDDKIQKFLKAMADAKLWLRSDGRYTEVHTPFTTRAKELMDIYNGLAAKSTTLDERLDILLNTKWTVKEFDSPLSREIVELIDREADMLNRGRPEASLDGLRKRLCNLFLRFIETPDYNPEAARFQKIPKMVFGATAGKPA